jgi:hypothetical protein
MSAESHPASNGDHVSHSSHHNGLGGGGSGPHIGQTTVHIPILGEGGFSVAVQGMMFMGAMHVLLGNDSGSGVHMSFGPNAAPVFHNGESPNSASASNGPGGGLKPRPGFAGKKAVAISEAELTEPGDAVLFYVYATGIGIPVSLQNLLDIITLQLGLVDITYRPNIAEPEKDDYDSILPVNTFEDQSDETMPPGWVEGMFGNTTKLTRRYQNASRINSKLSLWRKAQLKLWLYIRDHRAPWNDRLFERLAPRKGDLYGDSQLHLSQYPKPQKVSMEVQALKWNLFNDPAKDLKKNYIDSSAKLIIKIDAELFFTHMYQRWNENPVAFKKNQWLAFDLAKCAFKKLKGFRPPFPARRQEFLDGLKLLPYYPGRNDPGRSNSLPNGYYLGSAKQLAELERQRLGRLRAQDRLAETEWGPTFTPAPTPGEPDTDDTDPEAIIAPLVGIAPAPPPPAPGPADALESGVGVDLEGTVGGKPAGKPNDIVTVSVPIPVKDLR